MAQRHFTASVPAPNKLDVSSNLPLNWKKFERQWNNYAIASRLNQETAEFKCAVFLNTIGEDAMDIYDGLSFPNDAARRDLDIIIEKFRDFCIGKTNDVYESYRFHSRKQDQGETIEAYIACLRQQAKNCRFGDQEDRMIRDQVVMGVREDQLREKLLEKQNLTLNDCLEMGRAFETSRSQLQSMSNANATQVQRVHKGKSYQRKDTRQKSRQYDQNSTSQPTSRSKCGRCGKSPSHNRKDCPAREAECRKCLLKGHYAAMCRSKKVRRVEEEDFDDVILGSISTDQVNSLDDAWHAKVEVNGKTVNFRVDTGADVSVVPGRFFKKNSPLIKPSTKKLFGPGQNEIKVLGQFQATLSTPKMTTMQELYVIDKLKEPLLGRPAIEALKLIERVNEVRPQGFKEEFPELFKGLGKMKSVEYKIGLKDNAMPFSIPTPRRLPLPMKDKVEEELKRMLEEDIIRPVTTPTDWCAPIVAVPKTNGKVRICIDFTRLNESVRRENFPLPTTDQLLAQLAGATVFSKLDCNSGFYQIPLHENSQELTTFITPFGRYCFKRLPFGISSGPEIFHREMTHILSGIPGVVCDIDDVLISGRCEEEHDSRLRTVLRKMKEAGVTLNEKCVFSVHSIKFLGHIISKDGIRVDPEKVEAITNLPRPNNVHELRRFLGMVNHVGKFAPNLANTTKPLRDLLKKENEWTWDAQQEEAFQTLKKQLSSAPVLTHYCPNKLTKVSADASSYGMGGVLLQKDADDWKPVFYASRSLTSTEQRYAQVEKEALALTWCCEKFSDFLIGLPTFIIETDHKPLLALMKTKFLDELTPRIQRFRMRMMRFSYEVEYTAGKNLLTADALSRAPGSVPAEQDRQMEVKTHMFVQSVIEGIPATDRRLEEIRQQQGTDSICSQVIQCCQVDHWPVKTKEHAELKPYWTVRHDLTVQHGLLLYQSRLVIPKALQSDVIQRLHEGHQGIVKCRALARRCVWWPGLSKDIEKKVGECHICEKERIIHPEPLQPTKTPDYPWQKIGADLFELKGHKYLLLIDYFSRWIEIAHLRCTTSPSVVEHCKSIFARLGIPEILVSDNGPQFSSRDFVRFAENYGFTHATSSPMYPQGNGEAERAVQTVKNLLKKADDPYIALLNYRATPLQHGSSPSELLMGRKLRTRVPTLSVQHFPKQDISLFKEADARLKQQQKRYYDQRHRARPLSPIPSGQPVWVKTPRDAEATVVSTATSPHSYSVQTPMGIQRRNRRHLRRRSNQPPPRALVPRSASTVLDQQLMTNNSQSDDHASAQQNIRPEAHPGSMCTRYGRTIKPPKIMNL